MTRSLFLRHPYFLFSAKRKQQRKALAEEGSRLNGLVAFRTTPTRFAQTGLLSDGARGSIHAGRPQIATHRPFATQSYKSVNRINPNSDSFLVFAKAV